MGEIRLENVSKSYFSEEANIEALKDLNLSVSNGEIISLVGTSGCGKTTALNIVAGFIRPTAGRVFVDGREVTGPTGKCGVVSQSDSVFPWMRVWKNVEYGLKGRGVPRQKRKEIVRKYLDLVNLTNFERKWPRELSGGMRKRVDLARAYAFNPDILLLDEPFGSLDILTKEEMHALLLKIWHLEKKTILFVTHDVEEAVFLSHRVAVMTPRPGTLREVINVPFPTRRDAALKLTPEFIEVRRRVVQALTGGLDRTVEAGEIMS